MFKALATSPWCQWVNSLWPNDAISYCIMGLGPDLFRKWIVAGIPEPMPRYWQINPFRTNFGEIWIQISNFIQENAVLSAECCPFCSGLNIFRHKKLITMLVNHPWRIKRPVICFINSLRLSDTYRCQWTGSSLVQVMACHLFGAKPLPEPMLTCLPIISLETDCCEISSKIQTFRKMDTKIPSAKCWPFCSGLGLLKSVLFYKYWLCAKWPQGICYQWGCLNTDRSTHHRKFRNDLIVQKVFIQ